MKLCFSTIGCPDWRFGDIVSAAKDLGYSAIEIRGIGGEISAPAMKELTEDFPRTKELLDRTGIKIACLTSGAALADHSAKGKSVDEAKAYIDLAAKVGAEFVRVMSTDKPYFDGGDIELCKTQYEEVPCFPVSWTKWERAAARSGTCIIPTASTTKAFPPPSATSAAR